MNAATGSRVSSLGHACFRLIRGLGRSRRHLDALLPLACVLLLALLLRVYWVSQALPFFEGDECEYLRLAENLVTTGSYVGLYEGPQLIYPPLFPAMIATFSRLVGSCEAAAQLTTVLAGMALVAAVFALARRMYGSRSALIAAMLVACHPVSVALSGSIYSESVYEPLLVGGVFFCLRYLDRYDRVSAILSGVCFGLAYLARPEALLFPAALVVTFVLTAPVMRRSAGQSVVKALPIMVTSLVLASPYVVWLSLQTGRLQIEGKSAMNYVIAERIDSGMSEAQATLGIGPNLREEGPWLSSSQWVLQAPSVIPIRRVISHWISTAPRNFSDLARYLLSASFGSVILVGLVTLGMFGQPWSRRRLLQESMLLTVVLAYAFILLGQPFLMFRYVAVLLPFLLVWASFGIDLLSQCLQSTARNVSDENAKIPKTVGRACRYVSATILLLVATQGITRGGAFRWNGPAGPYVKEAGTWIAQYRPGPKRIMSTTNEMAYYAHGTALRLPYAEASLAEAYIRAKAPDFVVLVREDPRIGEYYREWFDHGIPDPDARLVHRINDRSGQPIVTVYERLSAATGKAQR